MNLKSLFFTGAVLALTSACVSNNIGEKQLVEVSTNNVKATCKLSNDFGTSQLHTPGSASVTASAQPLRISCSSSGGKYKSFNVVEAIKTNGTVTHQYAYPAKISVKLLKSRMVQDDEAPEDIPDGDKPLNRLPEASSEPAGNKSMSSL